MNPNDPVQPATNPMPPTVEQGVFTPPPLPAPAVAAQPQVVAPVTPVAEPAGVQVPVTVSARPAAVPTLPVNPDALLAGAAMQSPPERSKKPLLIVTAIFAVVVVGSGIAISSLAGTKKPAVASSAKTSATQSSKANGTVADAKEVAKQATAATSSTAPASTAVNKKITTDYGYGITLNEVLTSYVPKHPEATVDPLVFKLTVTQESEPKYTGTSPQAVDFVLVVDGQEVRQAQYYSGASDYELTQAGYAHLAIKTPKANDPNVGYIQIGVPKGKKPTALRFKQPAGKVLGSGTVLPAKTYDIAL